MSNGVWTNGYARLAGRAVVGFCALIQLTSVAAVVRAQSPLKPRLNATLSSLPHSQTIATACVIDIKSGQTIFSSNADRALIPASAMKILTMVTSLVELGADFAFETVLAADGGNLYVIGDGDPGLGDARLHDALNEEIVAPFERWAQRLVARGMTNVPGDLIIDESIFEDLQLHPSWEPSDLGKWYAAAVGALNFNDNCVDITINPAQKRGGPAEISFVPETTLVNVINKCRSGGTGTPKLHHPFGTNEYRISGPCDKHWPFGPVAFPDPGMLFADTLRTVLSRNGITLAGTIKRDRLRQRNGKLPDDTTIVATHRTPIAAVLSRAGKNSQNLFAECLLKRSGYAWAKRRSATDPRGGWANGARAVVDAIQGAQIDTAGLVVADGSGLSRDNRCTARQLASLLAWSHRQEFGSLFHSSLATAGVDGSLRKRLKSSGGRVHAKTGTMRGVRALAGFVDSSDGPRFAFAIMFNGYNGSSTPYKEIQDRFCRVLLDAAK